MLPVCIASFYFIIALAFHLVGEVFVKPYPRFDQSFLPATIVSIVMLVLVPIDLAIQRIVSPLESEDIRYYPRFNRFQDWLRVAHARWVIILGMPFLIYCFTSSLIERWGIEQFTGSYVEAPDRVFAMCLLLWGVFWLADCLCRPNRGTIIAAAVFVFLAFALLWGAIGSGYIRE